MVCEGPDFPSPYKNHFPTSKLGKLGRIWDPLPPCLDGFSSFTRFWVLKSPPSWMFDKWSPRHAGPIKLTIFTEISEVTAATQSFHTSCSVAAQYSILSATPPSPLLAMSVSPLFCTVLILLVTLPSLKWISWGKFSVWSSNLYKIVSLDNKGRVSCVFSSTW